MLTLALLDLSPDVADAFLPSGVGLSGHLYLFIINGTSLCGYARVLCFEGASSGGADDVRISALVN